MIWKADRKERGDMSENMLDIYKVLNIQVSTPDEEAEQAYKKKLIEWESNHPEKVQELKIAYDVWKKYHMNGVQTQDDVKKCLEKAEKGIIKLQNMNADKRSKEYLKTRHEILFSILSTEEYYKKRFKAFCEKHNFRMSNKNEDDFLFYFQETIQNEFKGYLTRYDPKKGAFENWFNNTLIKYRFYDILKKIIEKARIKDESIEDGEKRVIGTTPGRGGFGFNFYELLLDISRLITEMYQHGFQGKSISEAELNYYDLIFTETVSMVAIDNRDDRYLYVHSEEKLFRTMRKEFLDFYTENICRTFREISESPLKFYKDLGIDQEGRIEISSSALIVKRKNKENKYGVKHLKAIVYYAFLKSIGKECTEKSVSAQLSGYKKKYYEKLSKLKELYYEDFKQYAGTIAVPKNTIERAN